MKTKLLTIIAIGSQMALAGTAQAQSTVYTNQSSFLSQVQPGYYLENFSGATRNTSVIGPIAYAQGDFSYTLSTTDREIYFTDTTDVAVGTSIDASSLTVSFSSGNVTAVGGNFFLTDFFSGLTSGTVQVSLSDGTMQSFESSTNSIPFGGFTSATPITSLTILSAGADSGKYVTLDNLIVGRKINPTSVPAPSSAAVFFGLAGLGSIFLRRRHH